MCIKNTRYSARDCQHHRASPRPRGRESRNVLEVCLRVASTCSIVHILRPYKRQQAMSSEYPSSAVRISLCAPFLLAERKARGEGEEVKATSATDFEPSVGSAVAHFNRGRLNF